MVTRWLGIAVAGDHATAVQADVSVKGKIHIISDENIKLQKGDRSEAYHLLYQRVSDMISENKVDTVIIKASAVSQGKSSLAHLRAAELRGVVTAAAAANTKVIMLAKAQISKTFGERKADEYIADDNFWDAEIDGSLKVGSREAALLILSELNKP